MNRLLHAMIVCLFVQASAHGAITQQIGTGHNWSVNWMPLMGLNDAFDSGVSKELNFVGDSSNPGAYMATTTTYVYFRMRVAYDVAVNPTTFSGAHLLMIDVPSITNSGKSGTNTNGSLPDYAFAWDSKSADPTKHGLEMSVLSVRDNVWNGINMDDIDGSGGQKLSNDINGGGRTTDGYVQTVDAQPTVNLGQTTFIDFSVSWAYLETYTPLRKDQVWNIALGSISNATDHNNLNADIGGGATTASATTVGFSPIPEPNAAKIISMIGVFILFMKRNRSRA